MTSRHTGEKIKTGDRDGEKNVWIMDACCLSKNKQVCGFDNEYAVNAYANLSLTSSVLVLLTCAGGGGKEEVAHCSTL